MSSAATLERTDGAGKATQSRAGVPRNSAFYALAGVAAVLFLPYLVPQQAVASDAYLFGYNNRAGVVLLVLLAAAAAIRTRGFGLHFSAVRSGTAPSRKALAVCLAVQAAACLGMIRIAGALGGFCESCYEIDRVWLLSQGRLPYTGFEWPFGLGLLYGPLWISRGLHVGVAEGYYVFWMAASLAGVCLLFGVIQRLDFATTRKTAIFVLLFAAFLPSVMGMGAHYTLLRYASPLYFILVVQKAAALHEKPRAAAALSVLFTTALLLISPEMAIAHAFACFVLLFPRRTVLSPGSLSAAWYTAMATGIGVLFGVAARLHMLDTLRASGGGADSFPVPLSLPVLFLFAVVFVCACYLVQRWRQQLDDNSVALIVVALPLLAAAMGRCDPGHILTNGAGLILAVFLYASQTTRSWRLYCAAFLVAFMAVPSYPDSRLFLPLIRAANMETGVMRSGGTLRSVEGLNLHIVPGKINLAEVYPAAARQAGDQILEAPFAYSPNGFADYHSSELEYGYFKGMENANTPAAVARKIGELAQHPERDLLLPAPSSNLCGVNGPLERQLVTLLFSFPYTAKVSHPESVHQPLCDYIAAHYSLTQPASESSFGYELWTPKPHHPTS